MIHKTLFLSTCLFLSVSAIAQKGKVQSAWRSLSDYESTLNDKPDTSYLMKANRNIDLALADETTKNMAKTHAYKARIMYYVYQYNLKQETKKLEGTINDKNARAEAAYTTNSKKEIESAISSFESIQTLDPKYFSKVLEIIKSGSASSENDDDLKLAQTVAMIKFDLINIAQSEFKIKEYEIASDVFFNAANFTTLITGKNDSVLYYNACVSAQKSKNAAKIIQYNQAMIDKNIASSFNYKVIYEAEMQLNNTQKADDILSLGRIQFPNDVYLMNTQVERFIKNGYTEKAIIGLKEAITKDSNNSLLYISLAELYNNLANPKTVTGKDTVKPANYEDLFNLSVEYYEKGINLKPVSQDNYFNTLYNFGALYFNYGINFYNKSMDKATIVQLAKSQKDIDAKTQIYYKKAIPYFEQALSIKPDDVSTIKTLQKLYLLCGNEAKAKEMKEKLK